MYYSVLYVFFL